MAAAPMTVAVHSQRRLFGESLVWCLATQPGLVVVGHTQQWVQLTDLCRLRRPEAVIVDAAGDTETASQLERLTARWPFAFVVLLSGEPPEPARSWHCLPHGRGLTALMALLNDRCAVSRPSSRNAKLTEREVEVLTMVSHGLTAPQIAQRLEIRPRSVENHKRRIYAKLDATSQAGAVGVVAPLGILDGPPQFMWLTPSCPPQLSRREEEILRLSAQGHSVRQIANSLGVAAKTVESQVSLLYRKLGVHNRAAALATARAHGLVP